MANSAKIIGVLLLALLAFVVAVLVGPAEMTSEIFWQLRLPRAIGVASVGAGLAVAGVLVQSSFGNPLADPFTVGIASAAALGAVVGAVVFRGSFLGFGPGAMAFVFALGFSVVMTAWMRRGIRCAADILLVGVVCGFFFTACATLILSLSEPHALAHSLSWLMGSATYIELPWALGVAAITTVVTLVAWLQWRAMDLVTVNELTARSMGVDVKKLRLLLYVCVAVIVAISVGVAGVIGFVGLVVPHALRRLGVRSTVTLIPAAFFSGAALVLSADALARTIIAPTEVPVGVILAIIGAPVFLWLARRSL